MTSNFYYNQHGLITLDTNAVEEASESINASQDKLSLDSSSFHFSIGDKSIIRLKCH